MINLFKVLFSGKYPGYDPHFNWQGLEKIDYISVLRVLVVKRGFDGFKTGQMMHDSASFLYKINLIIDSKNKRMITVFKDDNKDLVFKKAHEIKDHFKCRIFDCTGHHKKWID